MSVFNAVKEMLAIRSYDERPIPDDIAKRILEAARLSASSQNKQHWDFVLVRDRQRLQRLGQLAKHGPYISGAAMAIAVVVPDHAIGYVDGARAVQDMMLVAWDEGIGSNWVGNVNTEELKEFLNVPQDRLLLTIVPFGYPDRPVGRGVKDRKPLSEIAHTEQFGQPYGS
ncbi:MAG: nitroreductase family protein [Chloroflexota bacterium]